MNTKTLILPILLIVFSNSAIAKVKELATIVRTDTKEKISITLVTDANEDLESIIVKSDKRTQKVKFNKIRSKSGATLLRRRGIKVARLQSNDLDKVLGGHVKFIYLTKFNLFSRNEYASLSLRILKDNAGKWTLVKGSKTIKSIFVTPYRWGIKKVALK